MVLENIIFYSRRSRDSVQLSYLTNQCWDNDIHLHVLGHTVWATTHSSNELALLLLCSILHYIVFRKKCLHGCVAFKYLIFLTWEHSQLTGSQEGFPCHLLFIPSGWQREASYGTVYWLSYPRFIFTATIWDHWLIGLIIPYSRTVLVLRVTEANSDILLP